MKKTHLSIIAFLLLSLLVALTSCSSYSPQDAGIPGIAPYANPDEYSAADLESGENANEGKIIENPFLTAKDHPVSTLSADVDTASYTFLRRVIREGYSLSDLQALTQVIRTEEMVNYFSYDYTEAAENEMFGTKVTIAKAPWNSENYLMVLGVKAREIESRSANNLVFLIDVSGSMFSDDKLPLLKQSFSYLVSCLDENDSVSIVTYAGSESVALDGCSGNKKTAIMNAINGLSASGSTNGEGGIKKAYELAEKHFKPEGNNRIILASDGDFNVGASSTEELTALIEKKRDANIFLSVLGFGMGNYRDNNMSALAQCGNGVYHYIDCAEEAERIFATSLLSTIYTVAKDVKLQVTFDPASVAEYRLIGYENRLLNQEDFENDAKDAGEIGSGHTLTVCYELKLNDAEDAPAELARLAIRYKEIDSDVSKLRELEISREHITDAPSDEFSFVASVIEAAMIIRKSRYAPTTDSLNGVISRLSELKLSEEQAQFLTLLRSIKE